MEPQAIVGAEQNLSLHLDAVAADANLNRLIAQETFMNEIVEVFVHSSSDENAPDHFILNVNGSNQPVFRGHVTPMKRMFLEVLARMKETKYSQRNMDFSAPEKSNQIIPRTAQVYPFEIVKDPNRNGPAWLHKILSERA